MKASRLSSTSNTSSASSSRDPSPLSLYSKTLQDIEEEAEGSGGISRERSYSVAAMPRSSYSPDLRPHKKTAEIKLGCSMDEIEEVEEFDELDQPISSASSSGMSSPVQRMMNSLSQHNQSPNKIERQLRSREASASVPKLVLAHSASTADSSLFNPNPRYKLAPSPVALSARHGHRKGLSHSDKGTFGSLYCLSAVQKATS